MVNNPSSEPYGKIVIQGIINSKTFRDKDGHYMWQQEAESKVQSGQLKKGDLVIANEKMSKSKKNGVNPVDLIQKYGTDATRITSVGFGASHRVRFWRGTEPEFAETTVFLRKLLLTMDQFIFLHQISPEDPRAPVIRRFTARKAKNPDLVGEELILLKEKRNETVRDVIFAFEHTYRIGQACKRMRTLTDVLRRNNMIPEIGMSIEFQRTLGDLIILMSSIAPSLSSELWSGFTAYANPSLSDRYNFNALVQQQPYPTLDPDFVNRIKINYDGQGYAIDGKDVLHQDDEEVVRKAVLTFMGTTVTAFDPEKLHEVKINFLPRVKAIVSMKTYGFDPKKNRKSKKKKDEDSDDDD